MVKPKKSLCPGCQTPKADHCFGPPGISCKGEEESSDEPPAPNNSEVPREVASTLLEAVRNLSAQLQSMKIEQDSMKQALDGRESSGKSKVTSDTEISQAAGENPRQEQTGPTSLPKKFATAARNGEYVDFGEVLAALTPRFADNDGMLFSTSPEGSVHVVKSARKRLIDSFEVWLQVWNFYEMEMITSQPSRYKELATYRAQIQAASRKFRWSCVYLYDVKLRMELASRGDTSARLDIIDTTLYATILEASALRVGAKQCSRCKSYDHLVKDCPFLAHDTLEENKNAQTKSSTTGNGNKTTWKLEKWFDKGKEGCNLYQRKACNLGEGCKRSHVCKACQGDHPQADCTHNA